MLDFLKLTKQELYGFCPIGAIAISGMTLLAEGSILKAIVLGLGFLITSVFLIHLVWRDSEEEDNKC